MSKLFETSITAKCSYDPTCQGCGPITIDVLQDTPQVIGTNLDPKINKVWFCFGGASYVLNFGAEERHKIYIKIHSTFLHITCNNIIRILTIIIRDNSIIILPNDHPSLNLIQTWKIIQDDPKQQRGYV